MDVYIFRKLFREKSKRSMCIMFSSYNSRYLQNKHRTPTNKNKQTILIMMILSDNKFLCTDSMIVDIIVFDVNIFSTS